MQFRFQPLRAAQAAGVLVKAAGGIINYTKLLKLLHLADRQALLETGSPITGDAVFNMANGPVLSRIYDCIKDNANDCTSWKEHFRTEGYELVLVKNTGDSELSDYDVELLETLYKKYQAFTLNQMIDVAHDLPEWSDPSPEKRRHVSHEEILRAGGASPEKIDAYEQLNASVRTLDRLRVIHS